MRKGPVLLTSWTSLTAAAALAALTLATACGIPPRERSSWTEPPGALFKTGPYILLGKPGEAFIVIKAELPRAPKVEWWVGEGAKTMVTGSRRDDIWVMRLTGLPLGPRVSYRVKASTGTTPTYRFRAGIPKNEPFRFAAFGDTRTNHGVHRRVIEALDREKIDFILHTGDMVARGGIEEQWDLFFKIERPLLVDTPILPSIGNHDKGRRDYYRHYFLHRLWAKDLTYYSYDWGNLRVVAMDGGIECRDGCDQYLYVRTALREGARKGMMMAMFLHWPPYSSGRHGSQMNVQKPITDLSRRFGVELVVAGHDHNYERTKPIYGTTYVVSGSAGAPIRPVNPQSFTANARTEPHYVLVDVQSDRMVLRAVNLRGDTFDSYVIEPNPQRPNAVGLR